MRGGILGREKMGGKWGMDVLRGEFSLMEDWICDGIIFFSLYALLHHTPENRYSTPNNQPRLLLIPSGEKNKRKTWKAVS